MSLSALCVRCGVPPQTLHAWAAAGAFGPAWQTHVEGKWRHMDREMARRAVWMSHFVKTGFPLDRAVELTGQAADLTGPGSEVDDTIVLSMDGALVEVEVPDLP
jgi:DNA-binding transcriptional MerR regulator